LLLAGVAVRLLTFLFLNPQNNDRGHYETVQFIVQYRALPLTGVTTISFHPPLYYVLAAPFEWLTRSPKGVQFFSLVVSIATLCVFYRLIYTEKLITGEPHRSYAFLIPCFLPQFVMFGLYVSNDTLAIFLGALLILQTSRFLHHPGWDQTRLMAIVLGLGLLTKLTFLAFLPIIVGLVLLVRLRTGHNLVKSAAPAIGLLFLALVIGGYKFIENSIYADGLFATGLDNFPAAMQRLRDQQATYRGINSFLDVNLGRLLVSPTVSRVTEGSYPVLLYGTFWYQHFPESNFISGNTIPYLRLLGCLIYVVSFVPTLVFCAGLGVLVWKSWRVLGQFDLGRQQDKNALVAYVSLSLLLASVAMVVAMAFKFQSWSFVQGRYLFPSMFGFVVTFTAGITMISRVRIFAVLMDRAMQILIALWAVYLATEIGHLVLMSLL